GQSRTAASAALPGIFREGEPASAAPQRAPDAAHSRRGRFPPRPAARGRLAAALFRAQLRQDGEDAGAGPRARLLHAQRRSARDRRQPSGGPGAQVAPRARAAMKSLLWLLALFAAAVALVVLGRVDAG